MEKTMNDDIIELQTKLTYQEHTIQELSGVMYDQQKTIDKLVLEVQALKEHVLLLLAMEQKSQPIIPPPHY
jgi:SlyX protein